MTPDPILISLVGLLAGIVASLLGLGGGMLMTPFLASFGLPLALVVPTSTCAIAGTALLTTVMNWRLNARSPDAQKKSSGGDLRVSLVVTIAMIPALECCTWVNRWLRTWPGRGADIFIGVLFIAMMAWSLWAVLRPAKSQPGPDPWPGPGMRLGDGRRCSLLRLGVGGTAAGIMGGLLGVGGGRVLVPLFSGPLGLAIKAAIATSSLCILLSSCYSSASFALKGLVDAQTALWLMTGSLPGAAIGALALKYVDVPRLRQTYGVLSVAAMAAMALAQFGCHGCALTLLVGGCTWVGVVAVRSLVARPVAAITA
jgi:uncharacterized membrane protein YfcA